jgi:hypothetical protein
VREQRLRVSERLEGAVVVPTKCEIVTSTAAAGSTRTVPAGSSGEHISQMYQSAATTVNGAGVAR